LLSGAGQVASSWYSLNKEGAFDRSGSRAGRVTVNGGRAPRWGEPGHEGWNEANRNGSGMPW
jgi:hypothetical protein